MGAPLSQPVLQMEKCAQDLGNSTKAVSSAIAQLLGEVAQGNENYTGTRSWSGCSPHLQVLESEGWGRQAVLPAPWPSAPGQATIVRP